MNKVRSADASQVSIEDIEIARFNFEGLTARIRFNPDEGRIWLQNERMLLLHLKALAALRSEVIERLGIAEARTILFRFGHASGSADAALAREGKPWMDVKDAFMTGPRLHSIEGFAVVETISVEVDPDSASLIGEWIWKNSAEVEAHLDHYGISAEPVCWTLVGYASAFTSAFMGRPIIFREVECKATGAPHCRVIAKPAEAWDEDPGKKMHLDVELEQCSDTDDEWNLTRIDSTDPDDVSDRMVGISPAFVSLMHQIRKVAPSDAAVMLIGEPGVGKKSCARLIHQKSARARKPFVYCNCASQPAEDLHIDLFGIEKSGANAGRQGKFEKAMGGTIFLEDIHCLDTISQSKILSIIQNRTFERIGSIQSRETNVRIITSSDIQLYECIKNGSFRKDLYYKLSVIPISVPPLRERRNDIPYLIRHFLKKMARIGSEKEKRLTANAVSYLLTHDFEGNIAELESMFERSIILAGDREVIDVGDLASSMEIEHPHFLGITKSGVLSAGNHPEKEAKEQGVIDDLLGECFDLDNFERNLIERAVELSDGNLSRAAKSLGITRPQLAYRYKKLQDFA